MLVIWIYWNYRYLPKVQMISLVLTRKGSSQYGFVLPGWHLRHESYNYHDITKNSAGTHCTEAISSSSSTLFYSDPSCLRLWFHWWQLLGIKSKTLKARSISKCCVKPWEKYTIRMYNDMREKRVLSFTYSPVFRSPGMQIILESSIKIDEWMDSKFQ